MINVLTGFLARPGCVIACLIVMSAMPGCGGGGRSEHGDSTAADESTEVDSGALRPNILFISVDDLNDWIEPLGGHPQAITPNLTALAQSGINFARTYTASPACNPSRMALLSGRHTYKTGMYSNYQNWKDVMPDVETLPEYFASHGYWAGGAGKIFHNGQPDPDSWHEYWPSKEKHMPDYFYPAPGETVNMPKFENMYGDFDWAPIDIPLEATGDHQSVAWALEQLQKQRENPFFLAVGIYRPHLPWYVPREYFDLYPLEEVTLPAVVEGDTDDLPGRALNIAARGGDYHRHVVEAGKWREAVQGYLASITYADGLVGELLAGLEQSPHADNTIVILWSDHGWQLGEKHHWRKFALWENVAHVVMMMKIPSGIADAFGLERTTGARIERVTSLIDIFPTLTELAGLPAKEGLDGHSLVPLIRDPDMPWDYPAITTYDFDEFSVRTDNFRYIRYIDGGEELYDHRTDAEEWLNLADNDDYAGIKQEMQAHVPEDPAPFGPTIELMPHHVPPFTSLQQYQDYVARHQQE